VFGIPNWHIVNAAFTHARPDGSRFNGADRGAWYCAFALDTAQAEVAFHFAQTLREVNWQESETGTYREYLADFRAEFPDIRKSARYAACLDPASHVASQQLARELLHQGSAGVIYSSVSSPRRYMPRLLPAGVGGQRQKGLGGYPGIRRWVFRAQGPH